MEIDPKVRKAHNARLLQIGAICEQWSYLEYLVLCTMRKLLEVDEETGKILFGGLDIRPRIAMASELAKHLKAPMALRKALAATAATVDGGLAKRRNRAIHGVQFLYVDGELRVELHRGKDRARRPLSKADLWSIAEDIRKIGQDLCDVINRVLWKTDPPPYTLLEKPVKQSRKRQRPTQGQKPKPRARQPKASPK